MTGKRSTYVLKLIGYAVVAIAVILAFLVVGSRVMIPKDNSPEAGMIEPEANGVMGEPVNSIDALIVGDSEVYNAISPLQMWKENGFTSYACASPGQALAYSNTILRRAYTTQHPQIVVIEAGSIFKDLTVGNALARIAQDMFPLIEYHSRWKSLTPADFVQEPKATWTDELKGFRVYEQTVPAAADGYMEPTDEVAPIARVNDVYLNIIVDYCRQNGAVPVLISVPSVTNWNMARHNAISAWAAEHDIDFFDFNTGADKVDIDWKTQTKDEGNHLNYDGAVIFTRALGKLLAERYSLPDHRSDARYAVWDADYDNYMAIVASGGKTYKEA